MNFTTPTIIPGPIQRSGSFLWQLDISDPLAGNLWSGRLDANNGYDSSYAIKAARLFEAAPALLLALSDLVDVMTGRMEGETVALHNALAAIAKATKET